MNYYGYSVQLNNGQNREGQQFATSAEARCAAIGAAMHWPDSIVIVVQFDSNDEEYYKELEQITL